MKTPILTVIALLATSCQSTTTPTPVAQAPDILAIAPAMEALKLSSNVVLTAAIIAGDGTRRTVAASWSSDAPDVVSIQPDGRIFGVQLGRSTIRASYETLTASLSMRVVPDYGGNWNGEYRVAGCVRVGGGGPDPFCRFTLGATFRLRTTLAQSGAILSGTLDLYDNTGRVVVETGPVDGTVDETDALRLSGTLLGTDLSERDVDTLSDWNTALSSDSASMKGKFVRNWSFQNFWGPQQLKVTGEPLTLRR
jgi:hypothetical protein